MAKIKKGELFGHLSGFLKTKGIELQKGSYTRRIQKGCTLLTDTINVSQDALTRAKKEMDKGLRRMRQIIERKKAGGRPGQATPSAKTTSGGTKAKPTKAGAKKSAKGKSRKG